MFQTSGLFYFITKIPFSMVVYVTIVIATFVWRGSPGGLIFLRAGRTKGISYKVVNMRDGF